jgi:DNA gyrase/topoisomerase IV subunit B
LQAIRKRPERKISSADERGLHNLVFETANRAVLGVLGNAEVRGAVVARIKQEAR